MAAIETNFHSKQTNNHPPENWRVQDIAARDQLAPTISDVGKWCYVVSTQQYFALLNFSPVTWIFAAGALSDTLENVAYKNQSNLFTVRQDLRATASPSTAAALYAPWMSTDTLPTAIFGANSIAPDNNMDAIRAYSGKGRAVYAETTGTPGGVTQSAIHAFTLYGYGVYATSEDFIPALFLGRNNAALWAKQQNYAGTVAATSPLNAVFVAERAFDGLGDNSVPTAVIKDNSLNGVFTGNLLELQVNNSSVIIFGRDGSIEAESGAFTGTLSAGGAATVLSLGAIGAISTTGNISGNDGIFSNSLTANGAISTASYIRAYGAYTESTTSPGVYAGIITSEPRMLFANGNSAQNWQIDNSGGNFRWYLPGAVHMYLSAGGLFLQRNKNLYFYRTSSTNADRQAAAIFSAWYDSTDASYSGELYFATTHFASALTERMRITSRGSVLFGTAALATNATDAFPYIPSMPGVPSGTPTAYVGRVPIVIDSTNSRLYAYVGGAWKYAALV